MTAGESYANPLDFDMTAATGSHLFDFPDPAGPSVAPWVYHDSANTSTTYFPTSAAVDGNTNTCWETNGLDVGNTWYAIAAGDGNPITMSSYQLQARSGWAGRMPSDWTLEGSDDGAAWTVVDTQSGITNWGADAVTFTPAAPATNKYFRINVSAIWADGIVNLGEFYLNNTPNPLSSSGATPAVFFYVRMRNLPECREYSLTVTAGTTNIYVNEYSAWIAWVEAEAENSGDAVGYFRPGTAQTGFIDAFGTFRGGGIIVRFKLTGYGTFTWAWTSVDYPVRPYSWFNPKPLTGASGVEHYQDWYGIDNLFNKLFYTLTPTTTDLITITANEPDNYFEVYRETGRTSYDAYIEDGYNLYHGGAVVDPNGGDCTFQPVGGETYVIVVYTNTPDDPANRPTWDLTWSSAQLVPPPYVVSNDELTTPITIPISGTSGSFAYDNTGATTGTLDGDKRSIWYAFTVPTYRYIYFHATPGNPNAGAPSMSLWHVDGSYVDFSTVNWSVPSRGNLVTRGVPGTTYLLEMSWPDSNPGTAWDDAGSCSWSLYDIPNDAPETALTLTAGSAQNSPANGPIPEFRGAGLWFRIVMPADGALCMVIEVPDDQLIAHSNYYNYFNGALYLDQAGYDMYGTWQQRQLWGAIPVKNTSGTSWKMTYTWVTAGPMVRAAKAGDVFMVYVMAPVAGALLRWNVVTEVEWGTWKSSDWNAVNNNTGAIVYNSATDSYDSLPAPSPVKTWSTRLMHSLNAQTVSWGASAHQELPQSGAQTLDCGPFGGLLTAAAGGSNATGPNISSLSGGNEVTVSQSWSLSGLVDPNGDREQWDVSYGMTVGGVKIGVAGKTDPANLNMYRYAQVDDRWGFENTAPIQYAASHGLEMADPNYVAQRQDPIYKDQLYSGDQVNEIGQWLYDQGWNTGFNGSWMAIEIRQFTFEWSADNPANNPRFDLFRTTRARWHKRVNGMPMTSSPYVPSFFPDATLIEQEGPWIMPGLGGMNPPSFQGPFLGGVSVDHFQDASTDAYDGAYSQYGNDVDPGQWPINMERNRFLSDVTIGQYPDINWDYTESYGSQVSNFPEGIPYGDMVDKLVVSTGGWSGLFGWNWWPAADYSVSWTISLYIARKYPDQYRVGRYAPALRALNAVDVPAPLPGVVPGTSTSSSSAGEYVYQGDTGVGTTPPVLWFLYQKWAFLGDHIVAYGQGLGDTQASLHGVLRMGPGTSYPLSADIAPAVTAWKLNAASTHAYDGSGVIYPGTTVSPPRVDAEVQTVEFVIPTGMTLTEPTEMHIYVTNDHGQSNALQLMLYPKVALEMQSPDPLLVTASAAMGVFEVGPEPLGDTFTHSHLQRELLLQNYSRVTTDYVVTGSFPERAPVLLTNAAPAFALTGGTATTGLDDPVTVKVPLTQRYRPIDSQVVPRSDIATGASLWMPNGTNANAWKILSGSSPFIDPTTTIPSRNGEITRPAMVFPGDAYAELVNGLPVGPNFSIAMVTTIYPDPQPRSFLLSSFIQGAPDPDTFPLQVYVEGDMVTVQVGGRIFTTRIARGYLGRRPVVLLLSITRWYVRFGLVSATSYVRDGSHALQNSSGLKLYLGRSNDAGTLQMATMDVLDLAINNTALSVSDFTLTLNRFDSMYGVMK